MVTGLLITMLVGCGSMPSRSAPDGFQQSGTFVVRETNVMRLANGTSGEGTLIFRGWQHQFTVEGAKLDIAGNEPVEIEGTVYNLETLEDFEGTYQPEEVDFAGKKGLEGIWVKNDKGVTAYIRVLGQEVTIKLEAEGGKITLEK